jgi:hypothetical protein
LPVDDFRRRSPSRAAHEAQVVARSTCASSG